MGSLGNSCAVRSVFKPAVEQAQFEACDDFIAQMVADAWVCLYRMCLPWSVPDDAQGGWVHGHFGLIRFQAQPMNKAFTKESDDDDDDEGASSPAMPAGTKNYITPAGYARLRAELLSLLDVERPKVVETVSWAAKNGDVNAGQEPRVFAGEDAVLPLG